MADFLSKIGKTLGISNVEGATIASQLASGNLLQAGLTTLGSLGGEGGGNKTPSDVSAPPAGVDSPATLSTVSQTSQFVPKNIIFEPPSAPSGLPMANQAFIGGGLLPGLTGTVGSLLKKPGVGGALTGLGGALGFDIVTDMFGNQKKLVITRKLQRDVKKVFMMSGGDIGFVSNNSMMLFGKSLSQEQVLQILFKTFKNQGPYVTKAAVRKTRATIRKMETLCDLKDRLCPPKRRAPARKRTMSTSITQVK